MKLLDKTIVKFLLVGVINTLIGTGIMFFLYNIAHMNYWISSAFNYIIGSIVSYFLNKYYTFENRSKSRKQLLKFIVNISVCYFVAYGVAKPLINRILTYQSQSIQENIAMLAGMCLFVGLNYFGQRFFVFLKD